MHAFIIAVYLTLEFLHSGRTTSCMYCLLSRNLIGFWRRLNVMFTRPCECAPAVLSEDHSAVCRVPAFIGKSWDQLREFLFSVLRFAKTL